MGQVVLQPAEATAHDTTLNLYTPNTNEGSASLVYLDAFEVDKARCHRRTVMDWDMTQNGGVPAGATITSSSKLEAYVIFLYQAERAFKIHRITRADHVELEETYMVYKSGTSWTTAGGDYTTPTITCAELTLTGFRTITTGAGLAAFLQDALDNRSSQARMLFIHDNEGADLGAGDYGYAFGSSSRAAASERPKLTIDYTVAGEGGVSYGYIY